MVAKLTKPRPWRPALALAVSLSCIAVAAAMLQHELRGYDYRTLRDAVQGVSPTRITLALGLTVVCYLALFGYDLLAIRYVGRRMSWRRTALASFIAYAFSQSLGLSALTGASIRLRFWSTWGLTTREIAEGVAFTTLSFWLGVLAIGGVALIVEPVASHRVPFLPIGAPAWSGLLLLGPVVVYLVACWRAKEALQVRGRVLRLPSLRIAVAQVAVSTLDWALAGAVLWTLLPAAGGVSAVRLLGFFVVAQVVSLASHVPGGLGVFESMMLVFLRPYLPASDVAAALIVYRVVYYLLPLGVAILTLGAYEAGRGTGLVGRSLRVVGRVVPAAAPYWLSGATFIAGGVLLVSGSTPSVHSRMRWLDAMLPLVVIEVSHFAASVAGVVLLILANGLRRRLDAAYHLSVAVLSVGIATSLLKGGDFEEALILTIVLLALLPARRHFYRRSTLLSEPMSADWMVAIVLTLCGTVALGIFAFKHVDYGSALWWRFAVLADAPRVIRATVGVSVCTLGFAFARLLAPRAVRPSATSVADRDRVRPMVRTATSSTAHLALLGDKSLLFSASGQSFLMYGVRGRSWVALGDPVGLASEARELAWMFRERADRAGGRASFYEVGGQNLPLYIDLGFSLIKVGEEARVPLTSFTVQGNARKSLRRALRDAEQQGITLEVVPPDGVGAILPELRRISDEWKRSKSTREKGFSLGFFDEAYLRECPVAAIRQDGRMIAFTNLWSGDAREELSVDLMRHADDAPRGVMDYTFITLMTWGREQGYAWFNLGMAPLAGLERRALAPAWSRMGALVYAHGEHFYNFRGLRQYKEKFDPVWSPRYLASGGGLSVATTLLDVTSLVSGGLRGAIAK